VNTNKEGGIFSLRNTKANNSLTNKSNWRQWEKIDRP